MSQKSAHKSEVSVGMSDIYDDVSPSDCESCISDSKSKSKIQSIQEKIYETLNNDEERQAPLLIPLRIENNDGGEEQKAESLGAHSA